MCKICRSPEGEKLDVIACLDRGETDRQIAAKSRFSRMSVWRFRKCLREERALLEKQLRDARLKNAKPGQGRIIVQWLPALHFTLDGQPFDFLRDFDVKHDQLIVAEFDAIPDKLPNPPKPKEETSPGSHEGVTEIVN